MATTYRARDTILHCDVALKVISRQVAAHPAARTRFLREARAAAKLHHPNIAGVSHYGEQAGECYYAMELVEGETLETLVQKNGPLSSAFALEIAIQVAKGLAAAEACRVVHRDLKPSNIMIVAADRAPEKDKSVSVKVIDWGLAKAFGVEATLGADCTFGGFVGTPAFASPEQLAPEEALRLDTRSDIYSLGVTLWFLLCGRTPFIGKTLEEIHDKQVDRTLPVDQLAARAVPTPVIALLRRMLAVDPDARPQSARELLADFERCEAVMKRARFRKMASYAVGATLALGALFWGLELARERQESHRISRVMEDRSIAVLPFAYPNNDTSEAFLAAGLQDEINSELALVAQLKVIGAESASNYSSGDRNLVQISRELGVRYLLEGSVQRSGSKALVAIALSDPKDRKKDWNKSYECEITALFDVQRQITGDVANRLRATLSAQEKLSLDEPPTTDRIAYDLYLRSRQGTSMYKGPTEMLLGDNKKIALLEEAVARDPNFVFAYCEIAELHDGLEEIRADLSTEDLSVDHRALAEMALARARRLKPDDGRVHLAQANHLRVVVRDYQQARIEAELARRVLPNNSAVEELIAFIAREEGRWEEALSATKRAIELQPRDPLLLDDLVQIYRATRNYREADSASERLLAVKREEERFYQRLFRASAFLEGYADLEPLREAIAAARPADKREAALLQTFRLLLALCAHDPDGINNALADDLRPRIVYYGNTFSKAWFQALAARMRGDVEGTQKAFAIARSEMEQLVQAKPSEARLLSMLAMIDAGLGNTEQAVREAERAHEMLPLEKSAVYGPAIACNLAVVYAWTNKTDQAIALLGKLVPRGAGMGLMYGPTYGDLRLNPGWDPLRNDTRFSALVQRLAPEPLNPVTPLQ